MSIHPPLQHKLSEEALARSLAAFNARDEILWFRLEGAFRSDGVSIVRYSSLPPAGLLGGGGVNALNGAAISAGFDAVCVLAGLGQYPTDTVVTVQLSIQFLALARINDALRFSAVVNKAGRRMCFVQSVLADDQQSYAVANAVLSPIYPAPTG